jgi:glycosyltransferase involved in cell wall biosynthesis
MSPDVAVLIAAYNAESTIELAIKSVISSSLPCRIFVVDDASHLPASQYLKDFGDQIIVIRLEHNGGPAAARNVGLREIAKHGFKYVAIMDADDISYPTRLAVQAAYLDANPDVGAVGTWTRLFDEKTGETIRINRRPTEPDAVQKLMFFNIGLSHASAMMRMEALRQVGFYSTAYPAAEDYELLRRIGERFRLANIPECLLHYRISSTGQSLRRRGRQLYDRLRVQLKFFKCTEWRAWAGVVQTLFLFLVPLPLLRAAKSLAGGK